MTIYIVVFCCGGLPHEVKPFFTKEEADQYQKQLKSPKTFTEGEDTVATYHEELPLPASIETRIKKHLAKEQKP